MLPKQGEDPNAGRQTGCLNEGEHILSDSILRLRAIRLHSHAIQPVQGGEYQWALGSIWWSMEIDLILEWVHWWAPPHDLCSLVQIRLSHKPQSCTGTLSVPLLLIKHNADWPQDDYRKYTLSLQMRWSWKIFLQLGHKCIIRVIILRVFFSFCYYRYYIFLGRQSPTWLNSLLKL